MEEKDAGKVCEECLKETRIRYKYRGGFFKPRLKGINHLEVGRSKIISNPITIIVEFLYLSFKKIRNGWAHFCKWLFPRRQRIYREKIDSYLVGRTIFAQTKELRIPVHNLKIEFWGRRLWLFQWRKLSEGYTDNDGYFKLPFHLRSARNRMNYHLQVEFYQTTHVYFKDDKPCPAYQLFVKMNVPKNDLIGMSYNLRTISLPLWEYRSDSSVPRVVIESQNKNQPQYYSQGRMDAFTEQVIPIELTKVKHLEQIEYAPETISIKAIQADYPENLTVCIEKKLQGYSRSDEWFGIRMMNGMNKGYFMPAAGDPDLYLIKYFGTCNYDKNDKYAFPTAEIKFRLTTDGLPLPVSIKLTGQLNAIDKEPWQEHFFTPAMEPGWTYAKRIARVNGAFCTEVDEHFAGTHLNTEQYAIAAYRNLRLNPVACLLLPHLKEVVLINHSADKLLIQQYIPSATAISYKGLLERTKDIMGVLDWCSWKPMAPLSDQHTYARAENLFWDVVDRYVDEFFETNLDEIKKYWYEIYCFSKDLVDHSVPVFLSNVNLDELPLRERALAEERLAYYCLQYSFDHGLKRERIDGELKTVSPITKIPFFDEENTGDMEKLKHACKYIITLATFLHTWINELQYDDLGEILYSCGGLRFGEKESGILAPEDDYAIAPDLTRSTQMLWFTNLLSRTEYGFITKNEEGDVNPLFIRLLQEKKEEFAELGVDITTIESRTNI